METLLVFTHFSQVLFALQMIRPVSIQNATLGWTKLNRLQIEPAYFFDSEKFFADSKNLYCGYS